jgi:hypothetical protein
MQEAMKIYRNPANAIIAALGPYLRRDGADAGMTGTLKLNAQGIGNNLPVLTFAAGPAGLATFTGGASLLVGNLDLTTTATNRILLPVNNDAANPTLAIGNLLTGFYSNAANNITLAINGGSVWNFSATIFRAASSSRAAMMNEAPTATNPVFCPGGNADNDTGIGWVAADSLSLIAGAVSIAQLTEAANRAEFRTMGSIVRKVTDVNATPYTVLQTDYYLQCRRTAAGILTVNLPSIATVGDGFVLIIKDTGYNANTFNITVARNGTDTINNVGANYTINVDGAAVVLIANDTTDDWEIF